uniref:hypothetical protein n=1 Tax=Marinobacterium profundum TaxID=1714300 RepID=UPI00082D0220|nr:hypothetical protein [Marinobacterium profundum]
MEDKEYQLELKKISLDKAKLRFDLMKWVVIAVGAIVSFWVIDYGNLRLEQYRAQSLNERELLVSYMNAMETSKPEVWKRKLQFLIEYSSDSKIENFAIQQLDYINQYAELTSLYREAIETASSLAVKDALTPSDRKQKFLRFEQLYWAELPLAGESTQVSTAMVRYRTQLLKTQADPELVKHWNELSFAMLELSTAIRSSMPDKTPLPSVKPVVD